MAPGAAHPPMYDEKIKYPWHQYETTTKAIFMAVELTPKWSFEVVLFTFTPKNCK